MPGRAGWYFLHRLGHGGGSWQVADSNIRDGINRGSRLARIHQMAVLGKAAQNPQPCGVALPNQPVRRVFRFRPLSALPRPFFRP